MMSCSTKETSPCIWFSFVSFLVENSTTDAKIQTQHPNNYRELPEKSVKAVRKTV